MLRLCSLLMMCRCLWLSVSAQVTPEPLTLSPGRPVEREIASGESHAYQIALTAGQFARFRLKLRMSDATLILAAPDGRQLVEMNLTGPGQEESLSLEAATTGNFRLTVTASGAATLRGSYHLEATVKAPATEQDRRRLAAEASLVEASQLSLQGSRAAPRVIEKAQQALAVWRELGDSFWAAYSLHRIGIAYYSLSQHGKAIEYYEQSLAIRREVKDRAGEAGALYSLARGDQVAARARIEESLKISESLRAEEIKTPESRASFLATVQNVYQVYIDVLMQQHWNEPQRGFDALAVAVSERQRARSLLDLLAESRADLRQGVAAALIERERTLSRQLTDRAAPAPARFPRTGRWPEAGDQPA